MSPLLQTANIPNRLHCLLRREIARLPCGPLRSSRAFFFGRQLNVLQAVWVVHSEVRHPGARPHVVVDTTQLWCRMRAGPERGKFGQASDVASGGKTQLGPAVVGMGTIAFQAARGRDQARRAPEMDGAHRYPFDPRRCR